MDVITVNETNIRILLCYLDRHAIPLDFEICNLASSNRSWQSKVGTFRGWGMAVIQPTPIESGCD